MSDVERAVERLTQPHTEYVEGKAVEHSPLLVELTESASVQDGRGTGSGGVGIPINLAVIDLQDRIKRRLNMMRRALYLEPTKELVQGTIEVWDTAQSERAGGRVDDPAWDRIEAEFPDWVHRITEEVSPPTSTEVMTPCPSCGETRAFVRGDTVQAVVIKWYPEELDRAPLGKCRFCGHEWVGWGAMHYDLDVVNRDVLAKLGVDVSTFARVNMVQ